MLPTGERAVEPFFFGIDMKLEKLFYLLERKVDKLKFDPAQDQQLIAAADVLLGQCRALIIHAVGQTPMRECRKCGLIKPLDEFPGYARDTSVKGQGGIYCSTCKSAKRKAARTKANTPAQQAKMNAQTAWHRCNGMRRVPVWADLDAIEAIYAESGPGLHVDHIVPLKGEKVSGLHVAENLRVIPAAENMAKRNTH